MKQKSISLKDIAKALNLSTATVSRALQDSYHISEITRKKVKEYAEEKGYIPNIMAQSLRNKNSRTIGILLCSVPNHFFAEVINGIESVASTKDYYVIISQSHESYQKEIKNLKYLDSRSIDGLLVSLSAETEGIDHFKEIHEKGLPIVFFDRVTDKINTHTVETDNAGSAFALTKHLIESGFERIAHITSSPKISITEKRLEGYVQALKQFNLLVDESIIKYCVHGGMIQEEIETALSDLLNNTTPPDAILTASDRLTIKTFQLLKKKGISIPEQIAIAGYSNFSASELFDPPLTTIVQPAFEMGCKATELLLQLIESKRSAKQFQKLLLPAQLIVRESSRKFSRP
jgi:DNA-binding LacI/PurR family transcriptional regulator